MKDVLLILLQISMLAVFIVVLVGVVGFIRGGEFNRKYGNKLMRLRVATQAVAVVLLLAFLLLNGLIHFG
jgi:Hypoxia induced protein conserved region